MDMKLEVVVVPVSDVDRSRNFCTALGRGLPLIVDDINTVHDELKRLGAEQAGAELPS